MINTKLLRRVAPLFGLAALTAVGAAQVTGWGSNGFSQLLTPNATEVNPIAISALAGARSVSAGLTHVLAIRADGSVVAFGGNSAAQAGLPAAAPGSVTSPNPIAGLPANVTAVIAGDYTSYALASDGTLYGWGYSNWGELGNGLDGFSDPNGYYPSAAPIPGATNVRKAVSTYNTLGIIKNDGTVWLAGYNYFYTLGLGDVQNRKVLTQNSDLTGARDIAMSFDHGIAAMADGSVKTWGGSVQGYSFTWAAGSTGNIPTPTTLPGLTDVVQVAANANASYARTSDGRVFAIGYGPNGELGIEGPNQTYVPTQIVNLPPVTDIQTRKDNVYALGVDGKVYSWGSQAGLGYSAPGSRTLPTALAIASASRISAGEAFGLAQALTAKLQSFSLLETLTRGYRNVRAKVTLDNPAGPGGVVVSLVSKAAGTSVPNNVPNTVGTPLHVSGAPSPNPSGERLWKVRNTTAFTRTYQFWVFLTGVGWEGTVPPNSDAYFVTKRTWSPIGILFENGRAVDIAVTDPATGPVPTNLFAQVALPATVTVPEGQTSLEFDIFANEVPIQSSVEIVASKGTDTFTKTLTIKKESDRPNP